MIDLHTRRGAIDPARAIDAFIHRHGAWRVLRAALWAVVAGRVAPPMGDVAILDDRMRRDIGLPPAVADPRDPFAGEFGNARRLPPQRGFIGGLD
jgi:hypothetical protein